MLFLSLAMLVNGSLALAGEALIVFDLSAAIVAALEQSFLPPGTTLTTEGARVHGALITAGLYSLLSSFVGLWAVCRRSLRAATIFFVLQVINTAVALALLVITWMTGLSLPVVLANMPGIVIMIYLCVVTNSYRMVLKEAAEGAWRAAARAGSQRAAAAAERRRRRRRRRQLRSPTPHHLPLSLPSLSRRLLGRRASAALSRGRLRRRRRR